MDLTERIEMMLIGCVVGFVLGYLVRSLRDIKEELDEVEEIVKLKRTARRRDERGTVQMPTFSNAALLIVIVLTVWASFFSQKASNDVQDTQDSLARVTMCNQQYLSKTVEALNERTTYTQAQAEANVALQKAQSQFLSILLAKPAASDADQVRALQKYFSTLTDFVRVTGATQMKTQDYPYPTNTEIMDCLNSKEN